MTLEGEKHDASPLLFSPVPKEHRISHKPDGPMISSQKSHSKGSVLRSRFSNGSEERRSSSAWSRTAGTESYTADAPVRSTPARHAKTDLTVSDFLSTFTTESDSLKTDFL